jgi:hypothetical protein
MNVKNRRAMMSNPSFIVLDGDDLDSILTANTLAEAVETKRSCGGTIYEPLGMKATESRQIEIKVLRDHIPINMVDIVDQIISVRLKEAGLKQDVSNEI